LFIHCEKFYASNLSVENNYLLSINSKFSSNLSAFSNKSLSFLQGLSVADRILPFSGRYPSYSSYRLKLNIDLLDFLINAWHLAKSIVSLSPRGTKTPYLQYRQDPFSALDNFNISFGFIGIFIVNDIKSFWFGFL